MAATLTSTQTGASPNYYKYIKDQPVKTDRIGDPDLLEFTLVGTDADFTKLNRGAYIVASSDVLKDKDGNKVDWFTGYIAYDPEYSYIGVDPNTHLPTFAMKYQALSDEYILSQQSLGIMAPFINMTQGQILAALAEQLLPGMFDTSGIQDGLFLARYVVDPTKNFQDIVKDFSTSAVYRFWGRSKKLFFTPQDTSLFVTSVVPVTVDGDDINFTPDNLDIRATQQTIKNEAIVLGATEPKEYVTEYFVGDGTNAQFPLMESVFGIESALLLDDDFSSNQIDSSKWTVYDTPSNFLQVSAGYLNVLGGLQDGTLAVHLDSANLIPVAGNMAITHGDFDFLDDGQPDGVLGIVGGLWTQAPNLALNGCIYGILVKRTGGVTTLTEVVNGVANVAHTVTANPAKSYVIRTNVSSSSVNRAAQSFNYFDVDGKVQTVTPSDPDYPDTFTFGTILSEIDLLTGLLTDGWPTYWTSNLTIPASQDKFANYVLVASENLHLTVTSTTINTPFQATLETNAAIDTPTADATVTLTGQVSTTTATTDVTGTVTFSALGKTLGTATVVNSAAVLVVPASEAPTGSVSATFTPSGSTAPGTVTVVISPATNYTFESGAAGWKPELVGPNTVDGLDGLTPAATISQSGGITTKSTTLGTPKYQASNPTLTFFKNTNYLTSTTPQVGDQIRLKYRQAGAAIARVRDINSVATEAQNWGDSGIRSVTRSDLSPQPTTSAECEAAAAAIVFESSRPRFEGTYKVNSRFSAGEPLAGMVLPFKNLPSNQFEVVNFAELIYEVKGTMLTDRPEMYQYEVSFGKGADQLRVQKVLSAIYKQPDVFAPQDSAEVPNYVSPSAISDAWSSDLLYLEISALAKDTITLTAPSPLPAGTGIEVRSSDSGWGCDDGNNLIGRFTTQQFSVSRNYHNKAIFAKMYDTRNIWPWSEDLTKIPTTQSNAPLATILAANPEGGLSKLTQYTPNASFPFVDFTSTTQAQSTEGVVSMYVKGAAGTSFTLGAYAKNSGLPVTSTTVICNGAWIRVSTPFSYGAGLNVPIFYRIAASSQVQLCHASVELGVQAETVFCQTNGSPYGALSRNASVVRVNYPLVPPPPTAALTFTDSLQPTLSMTLPQIAMDVWGFEVRASDNMTVLEHQDVADAGVNPTFEMPTQTTRDFKYFVYTYNLLGEYSDALAVETVLPTPTVTSLTVDDPTKMLKWTATNATSFHLEIDTIDSSFTHKSVDTTVTTDFFQLSDADFFDDRWFRLTPLDDLGPGASVVEEHSYQPDALVEFGANEVAVIVMPDTATGVPQVTVPSNFQQYGPEYTSLALAEYHINVSGS